MELNNREIAELVWFAIFVGCVAISADCRRSFVDVLRVQFSRKILLIIAATILWVMASVWLLTAVGLWKPDNLKTTLVWSVTFAFVTLFNVNRISEDSTYFGKTARDVVSATALVTFIADLYTFPLFTWLFLTPFLILVTACHVMAKSNPKYSKIESMLRWLLALIGTTCLCYGLYQAITDFNNFASWNNLREFLIPFILTLLFLPYILILDAFFTYETKFVMLRRFIPDQALRNFAMRRALIEFGFNLELLRRWSREIDRIRPSNRSSLEQSFRDVKSRAAREMNPPPVAPSDGWSPYVAKKFLMGVGLATGYYQPIADEWFASSPPLELDASILSNNLAYYVEGDELSAKRLKLILNVRNLKESTAAEDQFWRSASILARAATGVMCYDLLARRYSTNLRSIEIIAGCSISIMKRQYTGGVPDGYSLRLTIGHDAKSEHSL